MAMFLTWADLTLEEQGFYQEFHCPLVNNQRELPNNNRQIYAGVCRPTEPMINAVCDTGDRLVRTINFRLTDGQRNVIIAWMAVNLPDHPDPIAA